jgi:hypothetical protein
VNEDYGPLDQAFAGAMNMIGGAISTVQASALGLETYEYAMVPSGELNERGADRWRVVAVPPVQEVVNGLGGMRPGPVTYLMERRVLINDTPGGM